MATYILLEEHNLDTGEKMYAWYPKLTIPENWTKKGDDFPGVYYPPQKLEGDAWECTVIPVTVQGKMLPRLEDVLEGMK